jgi:hypothetical protein
MSIINGLKGAMAGVERSRQRRQNTPEQADTSDHMHCLQCGSNAKPATVTPGSIWIEVVLWLCFLIPGVIYSIWRHSKRHEACSVCGSDRLIPPNSPNAKKS